MFEKLEGKSGGGGAQSAEGDMDGGDWIENLVGEFGIGHLFGVQNTNSVCTCFSVVRVNLCQINTITYITGETF